MSDKLLFKKCSPSNYQFTLVILAFLTTVSCTGPRTLIKSYDKAKIQEQYGLSIADAAKPEKREISNSLTAISASNNKLQWKEIDGQPHLLVATWTRDTTFGGNVTKEKRSFNTGKYEIWVTVVPETKELCQNPKFGKKEGLDLRLKQLIGLPPSTEKTHFMELWVNTETLFRPCPDAETADKSCGLCFNEEVDDNHKKWINELRVNSYYQCNWDWNYPWTQLGYTYDWNPKNKTNVGLSEFVVGKNAKVYVNRAFTTREYCGLVDSEK